MTKIVIAADAQVKVLSFNVWTADNTVAGTNKLVEIIQASGADMVGVQELSETRLSSMATSLGWHSYRLSDVDEQILSRYPVLQATPVVNPPSTTAAPTSYGVQVEITPGHNAWLFTGHLTSNPYQPYLLRDGTLPQNEASVIASANAARGDFVTSMLNSINNVSGLIGSEPVFLTGDFNEPSHLDWTQAVANATSRPFDLKVAYPATTRVADAGFIDAYRTIHPDPIAMPGYTWTPGAPPPTVSVNEVHDRIDFVFHKGANVTVTDAKTIGFPDGNISTDQSVAGYNADHRAVLGAYTIGGLTGTKLTFSKLGANGSAVPQSYADRVITSPNITIDYTAAGGGEWKFWEGSTWNLGGAANLDSGGNEQANGAQVYDIKLTADPGSQTHLTSFDLIDWADNDGNGQSVFWQLLNGTGGVLNSGAAFVPDSSLLHIETGMSSSLAGSLTLRLQHNSGSRNDLALDNVAFFQVVPEPTAGVLSAIGAGCLIGLSRCCRQSRYATNHIDLGR